MSDQGNRPPFDALAAQRDIARRQAARRGTDSANNSAARESQRRVVASGWDAALAAVLKRQGEYET